MSYFKIKYKAREIIPSLVFNIILLIKHIPRNIVSLYLEMKFRILNKYHKNLGITDYNKKPPIILSTTTFPERINKVYLAIETILRQSVQANIIVLNLTEEEFPLGRKELPQKLLDLEDRGLTIKFRRNNYRSHNKLIHVLKDHPKSVIITFDDDCLYPKKFVENLLRKHLQYTKDIIGYNAKQIKFNRGGNVEEYLYWGDYEKTDKPKNDVFLLSVHGILYPPHSINKEVFNYDVLKQISIYNDDIWFKVMSLMNKTKHRRMYNKNVKFPTMLGSQKFGLFETNVLGGRNDKIVSDVFKKYNINKELFDEKL